MYAFTFGSFIRAARLGFGRWHNEHLRAWVRVSDHPDGFLVEIREDLPGSIKPTEHYVWWEGGGNPFDRSPFMTDLRKLPSPLSVVLDENGVVARNKEAV